MNSLNLEALNATDIAAIERATDWANSFVADHAEQWEFERRFAKEGFESAAKHRLTGLLVPEADGGDAVSALGLARVLEEIAAIDFAIAFSLVCHNNLAGSVARNATGDLRSETLPGLVDGSSLGAFLLTEPGVGSDAAAISVTASRDRDEWI